jgi:hypothetical protein
MTNPNHEPAGSSVGGQFASGNAGVNAFIRHQASVKSASMNLVLSSQDKDRISKEALENMEGLEPDGTGYSKDLEGGGRLYVRSKLEQYVTGKLIAGTQAQQRYKILVEANVSFPSKMGSSMTRWETKILWSSKVFKYDDYPRDWSTIGDAKINKLIGAK